MSKRSDVQFFTDSLSLMEKQLVGCLRIVNNLQTLINFDPMTTTDNQQVVEVIKSQLANNSDVINDLEAKVSEAVTSTKKEQSFTKELEEEREREEIKLLEHTIKKVIDTHFSALLIKDGIGQIKISDKLKHYNDNILLTPLITLASFPEGFYTNHEKKSLQFLLNIDSGQLLIDGLDDKPIFYYSYIKDGQYLVSPLNVMNIILLKEEIYNAFERLSVE